MSRKEKTYIVKEDNRDKGKEFIITEMSAIKGQELASDIHREMMAVNFSGISPDVIAMGCAGLATVGLSVLSAISKESSMIMRNALLSTVQIVIRVKDGGVQVRDIRAEIDFEEMTTIINLLDEVFTLNFDFLNIAGQ